MSKDFENGEKWGRFGQDDLKNLFFLLFKFQAIQFLHSIIGNSSHSIKKYFQFLQTLSHFPLEFSHLVHSISKLTNSLSANNGLQEYACFVVKHFTCDDCLLDLSSEVPEHDWYYV